ncbi:MAG: C4-dicarboxylate transport transcriptional regulatory protein DctD [Syntrophaceae bacterium PtaU1.Bin231]|nr:MAG: C4-dicarboxylate transport transcriptional regulatory protein DctD [Syntrophaceae bacterium PtaU1.Bin231]HOG17157.1 response regulator [Syntrophales bacterium]
MNAFRILLVEDNRSDAALIREMISEERGWESDAADFELVHKDSHAKAMQYLSENTVDAILLDLSLPDSNGIESVRRLVAGEPNTPVVVLTGLSDETVAIQALQYGVQDYLDKDELSGSLLVRSLRYAVERFHNLQEKEKLIRELREALDKVKTLSGLLPICAKCKNVRTDDGYWMQVESYLNTYSGLHFTHSLCPACIRNLYPELLT